MAQVVNEISGKPGDTVTVSIEFRDSGGEPTDGDGYPGTLPMFQFIASDGTIAYQDTSPSRLSEGVFSSTFALDPSLEPSNFYVLKWSAVIETKPRELFGSFEVLGTSSIGEGTTTERKDIMDSIGLNVSKFKSNYLHEVKLNSAGGSDLGDEHLEEYIFAALDYLESKLTIDIIPRERPEEKHDFNRSDYEMFSFLQLYHRPVREITEVALRYPAGNVDTVFPNDWATVDERNGTLHLVPTSVTFGRFLVGQGGTYIATMLSRMGYIPNLWRISYKTGFAQGEFPAVLRQMIGIHAALPVLMIAGDLIAGAGIASFSASMDGISKSVSTTSSATNSGYGARIIEYRKLVKETMPALQSKFSTATMTALG